MGIGQEPFDDLTVAFIYHRLMGTEEAIDFRRMAERSQEARNASGFDRPMVIQEVEDRLRGQFTAADPATEFVIRTEDRIMDYDHDLQEFAIGLFIPGTYLRVEAMERSYPLVFGNAQAARAIPLPPDRAREFDERLSRLFRSVINEVRFRVVGGGDPAGAVRGEVIRAELISFRLLDRNGGLIWEPPAPVPAAEPLPDADAFRATEVEIAGLRIGDSVDALEATLARLFGPVHRGRPSNPPDARLVGRLSYNELGCTNVGSAPPRGAVCITALFDEGGIVRWLRMERVLPPVSEELFRQTVLDRYGPVVDSRDTGGGFHLAWGPLLPIEASGPVPPRALEARFETLREIASMNRIPDVRLHLRLADADWLAQGAGR
jgi:hypothetical protein